MTPLKQLAEQGQAVWIDYLSRNFVNDGDLAGLVADGVVGVTSNPTIFQGAIAEGDAYDDQIKEVSATESEPKEIFLELARDDIRAACDELRKVWDDGNGKDGWVSLEVDPNLAHDTQATIDEAARLHGLIDRPNVLIKIPATKEGLPAIEETIASGIPVNVTLIFSLERHREVAEAYIRGLERLVESGGDPSTVASVASFFVSRVDTEADRRLDEIGGFDELKGTLAIANAKLAYETYAEVFSGDRWDALAAKGATPQRCLWASTSTKNPDVPRHPVRRGAGRPRHRRHDAARDDRGRPGPRRDQAHARPGRRGRAPHPGAVRRGRRRLRRRGGHARARGRREVREVVPRAVRRPRGQARPAGGRVMGERSDFRRELGQQLRVDSVRASAAAGSGHPTSSMSAADLIAVLIDGHLRSDDHLIFSKGHASPLYYAMLKATGRIDDEELLTFRKLGSRLEGHPTPRIPPTDVATGSLGQGLPIATGVALAGARLDRLPFRVWCLCGDSEMAEGSMWESIQHAGWEGLDNLVAIIDVNRLGQTRETMLGWDTDGYVERLTAFGWHAIAIDGHDVDAIEAAYAEAESTEGRPTAIVARTKKGKGVKAVEDLPGKHGKPLDDPEEAIQELGGERDVSVKLAEPAGGTPHRFETTPTDLPT